MTKIRRAKKPRGYKACDPACKQADRVRMYKSAAGPVMGKFICGKTKLRTGKGRTNKGLAKKGYRNLTINSDTISKAEQRKLKLFQNLCKPREEKKKKTKKKTNRNALLGILQRKPGESDRSFKRRKFTHNRKQKHELARNIKTLKTGPRKKTRKEKKKQQDSIDEEDDFKFVVDTRPDKIIPKDIVKFGETVHAPPAITFNPDRKNLHSKPRSSKLSDLNFVKERKIAMKQYSILRERRLFKINAKKKTPFKPQSAE